MATPDTSLFTSSAQVFASNHTLPQIRAIHKALHNQVDDKAARLRTQVGGSYRELLGTADAIVRMRRDMDAVQATLGGMGGRCGRAVVAGKVTGLTRFVSERDEADAEGAKGLAARARLLEGCALAAGKLLAGGGASQPGKEAGPGDKALKRGDRLVVAAKVFVLSRLLVKSLRDDAEDGAVRASVEASKKSLASLRRRLRRSIEKVLQRVGEGADRDDVLKALCAYSLATSTGARDVLGHFLRVRGEAIALAFEVEESERERSNRDVLRGLELYTRTLLDVQALVPHRLTEALMGLKKRELLEDDALRHNETLRLDTYECWCGDEIQFFKPFLRHDDLDGKQAKEMLTSWAEKGSNVLLTGLEKTLGRLFEFKAIVELRTDVLQLWIKEGSKAKGFDASDMLNKLRSAINRHLLQVLNMKVAKLRLVGSEVGRTLEAWQQGVTDQDVGLWDEDTTNTTLSHGAAHFAQDIISRLYGRNDAVSKAVNSYTSWYHVVDDVGGILEQLRRQRWDNDTDEIEDEETIENRQQLLSKDDPQMLHERLDSALARAFAELDKQLAAEWDDGRDGEHDARIAGYLVRVLRDIRSKLPELPPIQDFGLKLVPSLHDTIARSVVDAPLATFSTTFLSRGAVSGRALWEGEPPLPNSPSPGTFGLLRDLSMAMSGAGMDLWSPTAVELVKQQLGLRIHECWQAALAKHLADDVQEAEARLAAEKEPQAESDEENEENEDPPENKGIEKEKKDDATDYAPEQDDEAGETQTEPNSSATAPAPSSPDQRKALCIQWLYDVSMLQACLGASHAEKLQGLADAVYGHSGLDNAAIRQRILKGSSDYWKRTSLLFGLLA